MTILGISCFYHDAAACLLKDGRIVAAVEEERLSRKKHDSDFPGRAIGYCLEQSKTLSSNVDMVVFYEKPFTKFERLLIMTLLGYPKTRSYFHKTITNWFFSKLWVKSLIQEHLLIDSDKIHFVPHHLSHAASTFFASPFNKAAILTLDGVGEWSTAAWGIGEGTRIRLKKELRFPDSIGLLYATITAFLGFEVNEGEYKVMGMAGFGKPRYLSLIKKLYTLYPDGSIFLNRKYFAYPTSPEKMFTSTLISLLGSPRIPEAPFSTKKFTPNALENQRYADIAASIQVATEEIILTIAKHIHKQTGLTSLCLAGGVALNGVVNGRIVSETPFKDLFIQPASGDSGGALGAALYGWYQLSGKAKRRLSRSEAFPHSFWGPAFSNYDIEKILKKQNLHGEYLPKKELLSFVTEQISDGKIVCWFQDRMEWGPRALGHRSILADPRRKDMKEIVNTKIKFREPFRPFAPSVLAEKARDYFDLSKIEDSLPTRFMTIVCSVRKEKQKEIPAVTHVDGTARVQTVVKTDNPLYYNLISTFGKKTGVYVLLNTSFNLRGEPIVCTPQDAVNTFNRSGMDLLVLGNYILTRRST